MAFITPVFSPPQRPVHTNRSTVVCAQARPERTLVHTAAAVTLATVASVFIHVHHVQAISLPSLPSLPSVPSIPLPGASSSDSTPEAPKGDTTKFTEEQADKVDDMLSKMEAKKRARASKM